MNSPAELQLRDIHLPDPVSWWPPGPGWWLLLSILVIIAVILVLLYRRYRNLALQRAALKELRIIEAQYHLQLDLRQLAIELSALLRRVSISLLDRKSIAALSGQQWLVWLDQQAASDQFTTGHGQHLLSAPYQAHPEFYPDALIELCRTWIRTVTDQGKRVQST